MESFAALWLSVPEGAKHDEQGFKDGVERAAQEGRQGQGLGRLDREGSAPRK